MCTCIKKKQGLKNKNKKKNILVRYMHMYISIKRCFKWVVGKGPTPNRVALRKHAYSNILKILPRKNEKFSDKNSDIFHISAQNIDCRY